MSNETRTLYVAQKGEAVPWEVPVQKIREGEVQVKVKAVAINPVDAQHVAANLADGCGVGCDFAGAVSAIGEGVTSVKVGDTVAGGVGGSNVDAKMDGTFSDTIRVEAGQLFKFPHPLETNKDNSIPAGPIKSFEQAASLGISLGTAVLTFAWNNRTAIKKDSRTGYAVIYGGGSILGYMSLQVAKYLGYKVIVVASKTHEKLLKDAGALEVVDYHDKDWKDQVKAIGGDNISVAYDCISYPETVADTYSLITSNDSSFVNFSLPSVGSELKIEQLKENIRMTPPFWYHLYQDVKKFGTAVSIPADPGLIEARQEIFKDVNSLLEENAITGPPITVVGDGLTNVPEALKQMEKGVHGTKLVIRL